MGALHLNYIAGLQIDAHTLINKLIPESLNTYLNQLSNDGLFQDVLSLLFSCSYQLKILFAPQLVRPDCS